MKDRIVWLMIIAICLLGYAPTANAAITVGESSERRGDGVNPETMAFSWDPNSSSCLVVTVGGEWYPENKWVTGVTFGGQDLVKVIGYDGISGAKIYCDIWYLVSPVTTSGEIAVTLNDSVHDNAMTQGAVILHGVDQEDPLGNTALAQAKGTEVFVTLNVVAGEILIDHVLQNFGRVPDPLTGQTILYSRTNLYGGAGVAAGYRMITTTELTTETWDIDGGDTRYVLAVAAFKPADEAFNPSPVVNAGPDQEIWLGDNATLAGLATDEGPMDGISLGSPGGVTDYYWFQQSGPGTATFIDPDENVYDPNVTFDAFGTYELVLQVTDGWKDANDIMTVLVKDPEFNPPPVVDAGLDRIVYLSDLPITLDGTVSDVDPQTGDPGTLSFYWTQQSGPGTATLIPTDIEDPNLQDVDVMGTYELLLQATDGTKDANDTVTVTVVLKEMVGYWPFDVDPNDYGDNDEYSDGTLAMPEGGYPYYDSDAAMGAYSIGIADPLNDPNTNEPNVFPHIDLGAATELDFTISDWTVSAWIKTLQIKGAGDNGKGVIFINGAETAGGHRYCLIHNEYGEGRVDLVTDDDVSKITPRTSSSYPLNDELWHFIVGMRRGNQTRIYRDGVVDGTKGLPDNYNLGGTSAWNSRIGIAEKVNGKLYKHFDGLIDDVRVYNYALTDPAVDALWLAGPHVADANAGADFQFYWESGHPAKQLSGVVTDTGAGSGSNVILWTTAAGPAGASFTLATDPATTVTFPQAGVYTLQLTVSDPDAVTTANPGGSVVDTVIVTAVQPTCADLIPAGMLAYDYTGGAGGAPDCYVTMADLHYILVNWAECNDPQDAACTWPF